MYGKTVHVIGFFYNKKLKLTLRCVTSCWDPMCICMYWTWKGITYHRVVDLFFTQKSMNMRNCSRSQYKWEQNDLFSNCWWPFWCGQTFKMATIFFKNVAFIEKLFCLYSIKSVQYFLSFEYFMYKNDVCWKKSPDVQLLIKFTFWNVCEYHFE